MLFALVQSSPSLVGLLMILRYNLTSANTWIAYGGSYPGALTAWVRVKYPQLVYASVASSAPVQAVENFIGYNDVVHASLSATIVGGSDECAANVAQAFSTMDKAISTPAGLSSMAQKFNTCQDVSNANDTLTFVSYISNGFQETVQYNAELPGQPTIADLCSVMTNSAATPIENLATLTSKYFTKGECLDASYADSNVGLFNTVRLFGGLLLRSLIAMRMHCCRLWTPSPRVWASANGLGRRARSLGTTKRAMRARSAPSRLSKLLPPTSTSALTRLVSPRTRSRLASSSPTTTMAATSPQAPASCS